MREHTGHPLTDLNTVLATGAAWSACARTGLLQRLARGPIDETDPELGLDPEAVGCVLRLLATQDAVCLTPAGWVATPWVRDAVEASVSDASTAAALFEHVETFLRNGSTSGAFPQAYSATPVSRLGVMFEAPAARLAAALPPPGGPVLDVGAGSAVWSLPMAAPDSPVVALDRGPVLPAARERAERAGVPLQCVEASLWDVDFRTLPSARVVCANVLHVFRAERARDALIRMAAAVRPGGDLVIVDSVLDDPAHAASRAAYALQLRLRQPEGTVYGVSAIQGWMREAGLVPAEVVPLDVPGLAAVRGVRPL